MDFAADHFSRVAQRWPEAFPSQATLDEHSIKANLSVLVTQCSVAEMPDRLGGRMAS